MMCSAHDPWTNTRHHASQVLDPLCAAHVALRSSFNSDPSEFEWVAAVYELEHAMNAGLENVDAWVNDYQQRRNSHTAFELFIDNHIDQYATRATAAIVIQAYYRRYIVLQKKHTAMHDLLQRTREQYDEAAANTLAYSQNKPVICHSRHVCVDARCLGTWITLLQRPNGQIYEQPLFVIPQSYTNGPPNLIVGIQKATCCITNNPSKFGQLMAAPSTLQLLNPNENQDQIREFLHTRHNGHLYDFDPRKHTGTVQMGDQFMSYRFWFHGSQFPQGVPPNRTPISFEIREKHDRPGSFFACAFAPPKH